MKPSRKKAMNVDKLCLSMRVRIKWPTTDDDSNQLSRTDAQAKSKGREQRRNVRFLFQ